MIPFESLGTVSYSHSMAPSCVISEIKRDIGRKSRFFIPLHSTPSIGGGPREEYCHIVYYGKLEWCGYPTVKKSLMVTFNRFDRIPACDGQTKRDGRTDEQASCDSIVRAMHNIAR